MIQLPFPSTIEAQPRNVTFLTIKTVVRKIQKSDGQMGSCAWTRGGVGTDVLGYNAPRSSSLWLSNTAAMQGQVGGTMLCRRNEQNLAPSASEKRSPLSNQNTLLV